MSEAWCSQGPISLSNIVHNGTTTMGPTRVSLSVLFKLCFLHKIELWAQWTCRNTEYWEHVHAYVARHGLQHTMTYTMTHMKAVDYSHLMLFWLCASCKAAITPNLAPKLKWEHFPFTFLCVPAWTTNTTTKLRRPLFCLSLAVAVCGSQSNRSMFWNQKYKEPHDLL